MTAISVAREVNPAGVDWDAPVTLTMTEELRRWIVSCLIEYEDDFESYARGYPGDYPGDELPRHRALMERTWAALGEEEEPS